MKGITFEDVILGWKNPKNCNPPKFPVIYFEAPKVIDCRGFTKLSFLAGDWDFSGHPLFGEDIIIDSNGVVFKLKYDRFVFPESEILKLSRKNILDYLLPAIKGLEDEKFLKEILLCINLEDIIEKMSERFSW